MLIKLFSNRSNFDRALRRRRLFAALYLSKKP